MNQNEMKEAFEKDVDFELGYQAATAAAEAKYLPVIEKLERERNDVISFLQGISRQIQSAYPHKALAQPLLGAGRE